MSAVPLPRLVLFPGLGIDGGIFAPQRVLPCRLETPTWIDPLDGETLENYSVRMAARIDLSLPGPLYLGGLSLGGCVALEAARLLRPRGVFLISSAFTGDALSPMARVFLAGAARTPVPILAAMIRLTPLVIRVTGRPDRRQRRLIVGLLPRVNARMCRWGAAALPHWSFRGAPPCPVYAIHGGRDFIVPAERARPDAVVPGTGHAVSVTHAAAVNAFIATRIAAAELDV